MFKLKRELMTRGRPLIICPSFEKMSSTTEYWVVNSSQNEFFVSSGNWTVQDHIGGVGELMGNHCAVLKP